jgi:hypothetical protein
MLLIRLFLIQILFALLKRLVKQVFYLPVNAPKFIVGPLLNFFQHIGTYPQCKWFLFCHNQVAAAARFCRDK